MRRSRTWARYLPLLGLLAARPAGAFGPDVTAADARFRFVVLSDAHLTAADLPGSRAQVRAAVDEINGFASHVDFVLVSGDLGQSAAAADLARELQAAKEELDRLTVPYHVAIGNHDLTVNGDDSHFRARFGATTYRFSHAGVQFIAFRTALNQTATLIPSAALDSLSLWLGQVAPADPIVVFAHHPLGPITPFGVSNKQSFYDRIDGYDLKAVFTGHYHGVFEEQRNGAWYCSSRALSEHRCNHDGVETKGYRVASVWADGSLSSSFYTLGDPPRFEPEPPVFAAAGNRYALAGRPLWFQLAARDLQGETVTYAAGGLPAGATFDQAQRLFAWTPTAAQAGFHAGLRFFAQNSAGQDTLALAVRVLDAACVYDDFDAGLSPSWTAVGGAWSGRDGQLVQVLASGGASTCTSGPSLADLYFEADVLHEQGVGYAGVVFRFLDAGNYYYLWNSGSKIEVRRRIAGVASRLGDAVPVGSVSGWHHVRVEAVGSRLKVYWDGTLRFEATDGTFGSGQVGLVCSQAAARFDNVVAVGCSGLPGRAPVLQPVGDRTVLVGAPVAIDLAASDPDGGAPVFSGRDLPPGSRLAGARFTWMPRSSDAGLWQGATFRASDGELDDAETVTFTVVDTTSACLYEDFADAGAAAKWSPTGGSWSVVDGAYTGASTTPAWSRLDGPGLEDFDLQARIRVEGDGSGNLVFRAIDATHYYYLQTNPANNTVEIRKQQGGTSVLLAAGGEVCSSVRDRWHLYHVETRGNVIRLWVDGERRFEVTDGADPYLVGAIGLRVAGATLRADDIVAWDCRESTTDAILPFAGATLRQLTSAPNPFNPRTTIGFELGHPSATRVEIFDVSGRRVRQLLDAELPAGPQQVAWDGRDDAGLALGSGVYLLRVQASDAAATHRLVLVK